jgi:hypothetical protein
MKIIQVLLLAAVCEAIWETLKMTWQTGKISVDRIGALVVGIGISVAAGIDFFVLLDIPLSIPVLGSVLTGILTSRGANFIHDLLTTIDSFKKGSDPSTPTFK